MEGWLILSFIALSTLLALCMLTQSNQKSKPRKLLPPGPWTLPVIGSLHHVFSILPHRTMMELSRRHGPVMLLRLGEIPTVVISSAEAAALVLKTNDLVFANRPRNTTRDILGCNGKGIAFAPYGEHWRQMRKVCHMELLSSKQVNRMEGIRADEVAHLLDSVAATARSGATFNVTAYTKALGNNVVSRAVFGSRCARQGEFVHELNEVVALLGGFYLVDLFPSSRLVRWLSNGEQRMRRSYGRIQRLVADIISDRKATRAACHGGCNTDDEDLLEVLLRLQEEESLPFPLTDDIIGVVVFDMFSAATDTAATTLEWAMSELFIKREVMTKVQLEVRQVLGPDRQVITNNDVGELRYMQMVIKEVLRLHPPAPLLLPREASEDCKIMDYDIPKGTNVFVNAFAISRNPSHWNKPDEFMPDRFENTNIDYSGTYFEFTPFGAGRRQCPGMLFATSTFEVALANLLYHFDWMLPNGASEESLNMSEKFGIAVGRKYDLQLTATMYPRSKAISI